ncbi:hypothetical protein FOMPIDRAFT_1048489 [Fomitopsis schrenkii]|uniref:F-box domain-containing protein n=1 Tax=Fomitopsis schrenkii TaxID=2126942 RepID=S8EA75_FOMSC|nr:hypothetical protein FOMPIDRAFT_1048489 [Fomitopsis schrenkii]
MDLIAGIVAIRPPRYCSGSITRFPQEIYDYIIDFLWYDPAVLARCCLVCSAFLPVAAYHLEQFGFLHISSRASFTIYARAFRAKENRRFHKIHALSMAEDPQFPFIYHFSISMPGCYVPGATKLYIDGVDWAIRPPHLRFFDCLTFYSRVTYLSLLSCRFKNAAQLRRLINALPGLNTLVLDGIDGSTLCDVPTTAVLRPTLNANRIQDITLLDPLKWADLSRLADSRVAIRNILSFCARYPSISQLSLGIEYLDSLACVLRLMYNFPLLSHLEVHGSRNAMFVDVSQWQGFDIEHADVAALHLTRNRFSTFQLRDIPTVCALCLMELVATPEACNDLISLCVTHRDSTGPIAQLLQAVTNTLRLAGAALGWVEFDWYCNRGLLAGCIPESDFSPNTSLQNVFVSLQVPQKPHTIERTLVSIISSITSSCLTLLSISLDVTAAVTSEAHHPFGNGDVSQRRGSEVTVDDFHTILNAGLFHDLPPNGVRIDIRADPFGSTRTVATQAIVQVKRRLDALFAPWLARNILEISYSPDPGTSPRTHATFRAHTDQVDPENIA